MRTGIFSNSFGSLERAIILTIFTAIFWVGCSQTPADVDRPFSPSLSPTLGLQEIRIETEKISLYDQMPQELVEEGVFLMGSAESDPDWDEDEIPLHQVYLNTYWLDRFEVTNRMYGDCVREGECEPPSEAVSLTHIFYFENLSFAEHPVINVKWDQAQKYCEWVNRRLPTEAEWEKAARGTDGRLYPWGNESPTCNLLSFGKPSPDSPKCSSDTVPVGRFPAGSSPYQVMDMAGNVWEWVADWYEPDYYKRSPANNPTGPESGLTKVLRGGAFSDEAAAVRSANRHQTHPGADSYSLGFRCAESVTP